MTKTQARQSIVKYIRVSFLQSETPLKAAFGQFPRQQRQRRREVFVFQDHPFGRAQGGGREVPDRLDPRFCHPVQRLLRRRRGHRLRHRAGPDGERRDPRRGLHAPKGLPLLPTGEGGQPGTCLDAGSLSSVMGGSVGGTGGPAQGGPCEVGFPPTPGGSPAFSGESRRKERRGLRPLAPRFMTRSFPLARFGVRSAAGRSLGYFVTHVRALIWRLSFIKCFFSIFFRKMRSKSVLAHRK